MSLVELLMVHAMRLQQLTKVSTCVDMSPHPDSNMESVTEESTDVPLAVALALPPNPPNKDT